MLMDIVEELLSSRRAALVENCSGERSCVPSLLCQYNFQHELLSSSMARVPTNSWESIFIHSSISSKTSFSGPGKKIIG
ncbi:hypothetical protein QC764_0047490 [Podospora pseudoanserina]|uniref:Uncharacterized protein n=1 Tax=Podospora pseudoanserina TaxID=2609844 RepID=A0ABR0IC48_9PEZI|nr:hypothetical protein QC764_0047490 [Podospora pseudoanserina]